MARRRELRAREPPRRAFAQGGNGVLREPRLMRIAALYDVHGNVHALEAVLREVEQEGVDAIVFGGDVVHGPFPRETLELARSVEASWVRGNCERSPVEGPGAQWVVD